MALGCWLWNNLISMSPLLAWVSLFLRLLLHLWSIYKRKDPISVLSGFLERKLIPRSYVEARKGNGSRTPVFSILSLLFIFLIIAGGLGPFFSVYERAPHIYKPLVDLGLDLAVRLSLTVYLAALIGYALLVVVYSGLVIIYRARMMTRKHLGDAFARYDAFGRLGERPEVAFGVLLLLVMVCLAWKGENALNLSIWVLVFSCPVWGMLLDLIAISKSRRVSAKYLAIFDYELGSLGMATFALASLPGILGAAFSFQTWLTTLMVPPYPMITRLSLSD
jgi:hypothetical protein